MCLSSHYVSDVNTVVTQQLCETVSKALDVPTRMVAKIILKLKKKNSS